MTNNNETKQTGYELSRNWFDWCFENPEKVTPHHTALYFYILDLYNRLGNKQKFGLPTSMAMETVGIKSYTTYIKTLNNLIDFGFIKMLEKSTNQFTANIIALSYNVKATTKAQDKALVTHVVKQDQSTGESIVSIDKPLTTNNITTNRLFVFDEFRIMYPGTKRGNETEFENFKKKHKDFGEILPLLKPAIEAQILARKSLRDKGGFVPEWKNLQTWINNRCWEEVVVTASDAKLAEQAVVGGKKIMANSIFNTEQ